MYLSVFEMKEIDWELFLWLVFFWTFHIWYKVMSNTCFASVKLLQTLHFLQKLLLYYYDTKVFP